MSSPKKSNSLYPEIIIKDPESNFSSSTNMYPKAKADDEYDDKMRDLAENLFPETDPNVEQSSFEEVLIKVPGAVIHLIDKDQSVELATGDLVVVRLKQGDNIIAVLARVGDEIQWPLAKDEAVVRLDQSHYFFTLHVSAGGGEDGHGSEDDVLSYGLTIASKGQEELLKDLDKVLEDCSSFSVKEVAAEMGLLDDHVARETTPEEFGSEADKKEMVRRGSAAFWTTLAPNVEDYSGTFARMIALGTGHVVRGILWCGDVTSDRMHWGHDFFRKRIGPGSKSSQISPQCMRRVQRVKRMTKTCDTMANGVLSGIIKVTGFFTSPLVNSKVGKKFFSLVPGEIILASLDGFNKVVDAVEISARNVLSTTSTVTAGVVSHRFGDQAGSVTNVSFDAAGHAIGTAWAVFKIGRAFNLKSAFKPTTIARVHTQSRKEESAKQKNKESTKKIE